ncbi:MAG TPA: hypothetical protein VFJ96_07550 [Gemmatimonadaceae bacterium]|nr:hypothetical protein [Gemmatimonadaceae bacterium]
MSRRFPPLVVLLLASLSFLAACRSGEFAGRMSAAEAAARADTVTGLDVGPSVADTMSMAAYSAPEPVVPRATSSRPARRLSAEADSIAQTLVFFVNGQSWFTAAARRKRLVVDIGRVDTRIRTTADRRAYEEAVHAMSPLHTGDRLRIDGPWGRTDATVSGFSDVNGRIVALLELPSFVDSLARVADDALVAVATRADSAMPPVVDSCVRDSVSATLAARLAVVSDSLQQRLRSDTLRLPDRLRHSVWVHASHAVGCFGPARVLLMVTMASSGYDYVREVAVLLDDTGRVTPLRINALRFKTHEILSAFDADGDGVDDIAIKGRGDRVGGTSVLRLDPARRRLDFLTQGFAWEGM